MLIELGKNKIHSSRLTRTGWGWGGGLGGGTSIKMNSKLALFVANLFSHLRKGHGGSVWPCLQRDESTSASYICCIGDFFIFRIITEM